MNRQRTSPHSVAAAPIGRAADRTPAGVAAELARMLHDDVAQELFVARVSLCQLVERLPPSSVDRALADAALRRVAAAVDETRCAIDRLRSSGKATETDLAAALRRELIDFAARTGISVAPGEISVPEELPPCATGHVIGIVREALVNVRKHADASEVRLTAACDRGRIRVTVADNGRGFPPASASGGPAGFGFGIVAMRERAEAIGGRLDIRSEACVGTSVTIEAPLRGALPNAG